MAIELGTVTLYGLIALIINGGVQWIREWQKHRTWSANGNALKEIKDDVSTVDGKIVKVDNKIEAVDEKVGEVTVKIAEVGTDVKSQKTQCSATVKRFDKAISDQNTQLISLAKRRK